MASKKYKGKTCVYCAVPGISETGDHVIARSFFLPEFRDGLPIVPACLACNGKKSELEHYAATIMPFGAQHGEASRTLAQLVPRRLQKNMQLTRQLGEQTKSRWTSIDGGPFQLEGGMPLNARPLIELYRYIVRGLAFHHWDMIFGDDYFVTAAYIDESAHEGFQKMMALNGQGVKRVEGNLGNGVFEYRGTQIVAPPGLTMWRMSLYGVQVNGGPGSTNQRIKDTYGITVHDSMEAAAHFRKSMTLPESKPDDDVVVVEGSPGQR